MRYIRVLFFLVFLFPLTANAVERLIYDKFGNYIETMDDYLFKMEDRDYIGGGEASRKFNHQRWIEDFRTDLVVSETRDDIMNEFRLGRIYTKFTPLTLDKTRFPPNYSDNRQHGFRWRLTTLSFFREATFLLNRVDLGNHSYDHESWDINDPNVDTYFVALRTVFQPINPLKIGLSYVNQHNSFRSFLSDDDSMDPLTGSLNENDYPSKLYFKFEDLSSDDDGGAVVYNIIVYINGVRNNDLSIYGHNMGSDVSLLNYGSVLYSDRREANGKKYFIYIFNLPENGRNIRDIRFDIDIANNYSVKVSPDEDFPDYKTQIIFQSPDDIKDYSNRKILSYNFSLLTGQSVYGVDFSFEMDGFIIKTDIAYNKRFLKYPNLNGSRYKESAYAFTFDCTKSFNKFMIGAGFYRIQPDYNASFAVEDNDDNDDMPDISDDDGVNFFGNDKNNNNIKDYNEDFILFDGADYGFRDGIDYNNNNIFDNEEDDNLPDYSHYTDSKGYNFNIIYWLTKKVSFELGQVNEWKINTKKRSYLTFFKTKYSFLKRNWFEVNLRNIINRINDNIKNDTNDKEDELLYQNDLVNNFTVLVDLLFIRNLILQIGYRNVFDIDDFSNMDSDNINYINEYNEIFRLGYNWWPFKKSLPGLLIRPLYKMLRTTKNEYHYTAGLEKLELNQYDYFILNFIYNFTKNTKILCGYQKTFYQDNLYFFKDYNKDTYAFQVSHKNTFWDKGLVIQAGYDLSKIDFDDNIIYNDNKERRFYIEAYFNW